MPDRQDNPYWAPEEDRILRELYPVHGTALVASRLKRSPNGVYLRAKRLGVKWIGWTSDQNQILRERYPTEGASRDLRSIFNRSAHAISSQAHRLGLRMIGRRNKVWTEEELQILKNRYPLEGASKNLQTTIGRTKNSIAAKARLMGLSITSDVLSTIHLRVAKIGKHNDGFKGYEEMPGHFIASIRQDAKKRDIEHPLLDGSSDSNKYLWDLYIFQDRRCALSGREISFRRSYSANHSNKNAGTASVDRINSLHGYVIGNVQWVHKHVNVMKRSISQEEFIQLANQIAKKHPRL